MNDIREASRLKGRRVLIVDDDYFIASDLSQTSAAHGIEVVGPAPSLADAIALMRTQPIDAALLDINLDGTRVYDVADALTRQQVPIVFVTGYDPHVVPARFAHVPLCQKPVDADAVLAALERALAG